MSYFRVMLDELNPDGSSVDVAPNVRYGGRPADISWGTATIAFPYAAWKGDGDLGPAKASMDGLVVRQLRHHFGHFDIILGNSDIILATPTSFWPLRHHFGNSDIILATSTAGAFLFSSLAPTCTVLHGCMDESCMTGRSSAPAFLVC